MKTTDALNVTVVQMAAGVDPVANLATLRGLLEPEPHHAAELVIVPEYAMCCGAADTLRREARGIDEWRSMLACVPTTLAATVVFGGLPVRQEAGRVTDSSLVLAPDGTLVDVYDKMHLFEYRPAVGGGVCEADVFTAGERVCTIEVRGWRLRLSICFDLRFPELYRCGAGYDAAVCTAAFTRETGRAHWGSLVAARAIENQCYVLAAGLSGRNPETGVEWNGCSCVIDPWGESVASASPTEAGVLTAVLRRSRICEVRNRLPALSLMRGGRLTVC